MKRILLSVLAAGLIAVAHAQVPGTLSYQGILVNSSGSPVADGTHYVQFRFYDDPVLSAGANLKYSSLGVGTGNDVVTYKGMFTFLIGSGSTGNAAIPTNIWNSQLWVEVTADGAVLAPRIQLSSNAYAFKAQAANTMDAAGLTGTANLPNTVLDADLQDLADGSLTGSKVSGLPAANISGSVAVANGGTGAATLTGALIGSGTSAITGVAASGASQYFRRNAANTAYEFAALPSDVTSVGLTMPSIFSVSGSPVTTSGTLATSLATQTANTIFAGPSTGAPLAPTFRALVANDIPSLDAGKITTGSLPIALGGTGGTTVSAARTNLGLDLAATAASNGLTLTGNNMSLGGTLAANTSISSGGFNLLFGGTGKMGVGSAVPLSKFNVGGNMAIGNAYTDAFAAPTNGLIVQGITGLGTSSPLSQLDVEGNLAVGTSYSGNIAAPTNGAIIEGNVGIGTSAPSDKLHIHSTTASAVRSRITNLTTGTSLTDGFSRELASDGLTSSLWNYENGPIHFGTNNINRATLSATGNLGIANTNPLYPLTVNNASNATSTYVANSFAGAGTQNGIVVDMSSATGTGTKYGLYNLVDGTSGSASQIYGYSSIIDPNGTGTAYGLSSVINGVGSGSRYGLYNSIAPVTANTSNHYGVYNSLSNGTGGSTGGYYGVFNVLNTTGAAVSLPSNYRVGTYNYVNESTSTALVVGTYNFMTNNGTGQLFGNYNYVNNNSSGTTYGIYADVNKAASQAGTLYGLNIVSDNDGTADSYLMYASSVGSTSGTEYGLYITGEDVNYFSNKVGMGTSSLVTIGTDRLYVNGTARSSAWNLISDSRFKTNVKQLSGALNKLKMLKGVSYNWRVDEFKDRGFNRETQIGFIAQEVEKVLPELVSTSTDGYKAMNYNGMTAVLVEGVNDQQKKIEELELVIEELKSKLSQYEGLSAQVEELKKMISGKSDEKSSGAVTVGSDKK